MKVQVNYKRGKSKLWGITGIVLLVTLLIFGRSVTGIAKVASTNVVLADGKSLINVYIDQKTKDYKGMNLVANSFTKDIELITGQKPQLITDASKLSGTVVLMGSIGNNDKIDNLIAKGIIDVSPIKGKRECYRIQVVKKPFAGVEKAIVVVGSDKRGAFYGIYHISDLIGVSPWYFMADVTPVKQKQLILPINDLETVSKEPSVKYRGIFLNDEAPSLSSWVQKTYGNYNEKFYQQMFELLLRLKGNYMWPAMWSNSFSEDGESSPTANAELADTYGIVMGTSHHEPMCRAGVEWQRQFSKYGSNNTWDFGSNKKAITTFWKDGIARNAKFENLITMGMRGEADSALGGSDKVNINLLKDIIVTQKNILKDNGLSDAPQVLTLYKEVEKYWYGTPTVAGLDEWDVLNDVTIMLCDDNFGNVRTLPTKKERDREAGWGMYYHFDYHGGPRSYEWVNTTTVEKVCEQMSMAYDYGIQDVWIVNVGDLKPMELPVSYFLDLAYDFDTWSEKGTKGVKGYVNQWAAQQFGGYTDNATVKQIATILQDYTRLNSNRKPEVTMSSTFSFANYNEAQRVLQQCTKIITSCEEVKKKIPKELQDTYYQLVYYPAVASANVTRMQIFAELSNVYQNRGSLLANTYAYLTTESISKDTELQSYYNNTMAGGKWKGMMSSPHVGYVNWNSDGWTYPEVTMLDVEEKSGLIVDLEGDEASYESGEAVLQPFSNLAKESYGLTISNGGSVPYDYKINTDADWIKLSQTKGTVKDSANIMVSIDWNKVTKTQSSSFTISGADSKVTVKVTAEVTDTSKLEKGTFVEVHDIISIDCANASKFVPSSNKVNWRVLPNYGRSITGMSSVKMFPTTISFIDPLKAPYMEYTIYVKEDGTYTLNMYSAPTNNLGEKIELCYGASFDGEAVQIVNALKPDHISGSSNSWNDSVLDNIHLSQSSHTLTAGVHKLRIYGVDAGLVLQKLTITDQLEKASYFGPEQTYCVGDEVKQQVGYRYFPETSVSLAPGTITVDADTFKDSYTLGVNVMKKVNYTLNLYGSIDTDKVTVSVYVNGEPYGLGTWNKGENKISINSMNLSNLEEGCYTISLMCKGGKVKLKAAILNDKETTQQEEKKILDELAKAAVVTVTEAAKQTVAQTEDIATDKSNFIWIMILSIVGIAGIAIGAVVLIRHRSNK